jgi:hypothetical protein
LAPTIQARRLNFYAVVIAVKKRSGTDLHFVGGKVLLVERVDVDQNIHLVLIILVISMVMLLGEVCRQNIVFGLLCGKDVAVRLIEIIICMVGAVFLFVIGGISLKIF